MDDGSRLEKSSELIEMIKKFPTAAFVAGRLKEVGWESDYEKSLLDQFREDLIQECGKSFLRCWNIFGLSFKLPSRKLWSAVPLL